ncbi:MAG TPA: hypothetical protein PK095_00290 [Myxococcota bacterium]|nr:hypothetical protein [Myxococcota bacterium]
MPGPKGAFKSVGKKLKKVFSKKGRGRRRARRHAGLPGGPGVPNQGVPQPQPQQQGPQGWVGGERRGERGGPQIGQNRDAPRGWVGGQRQGGRGGLQIGQRAPRTKTETELTPPNELVPEPETQQTPGESPYSNPYSSSKTEEKVQTPYDKPFNPYEKPFNPYEKGSDSGSASGDTYSTPVSEDEPEQVGGKKGEVSPYKSTPVESGSEEVPKTVDEKTDKKEENPYAKLNGKKSEDTQKVKSPYQTFTAPVSSGSISSSSSVKSSEKKQDDKPKELSPALKLERDRQIEMRVRKAQRKLKKEAENKQEQVAPKKTIAPLGPYENDKPQNLDSNEGDTGVYGEAEAPEQVISSSVSEINTSKYELAPDAMMLIVAEVERELGIAALDVQGKFDGDELPESVQLMMRKMREHSVGTVDAPEICRGKEVKIERGEKTHNEKMSKGWATMAMRSSYVQSDSKKGDGGSFNTKYFFEETTNLEQASVKVLGSQQEKGREKLVIKYKDNKWVDADDKTVDTSGAGEMQYAISMRQQKLKDKLAEAELHARGEQDKVALKALNERIDKLTEKLKVENLSKHKSVTGKYIYVMNAAGDFFAAKHVQFIMHHSSFLAGGAVATAGEVGISGGKLDYISNQSGHYRPGPAYLWQAVKQLELLGCPLDSVQVHVMTAKGKFKNAKDFLAAIDPTSDPKLFDSVYAIQQINQALAGLKSQKDVA